MSLSRSQLDWCAEHLRNFRLFQMQAEQAKVSSDLYRQFPGRTPTRGA